MRLSLVSATRLSGTGGDATGSEEDDAEGGQVQAGLREEERSVCEATKGQEAGEGEEVACSSDWTQMIFLAGVLVLGVCGGVAQAETAGPVWRILAVSNPTNFKPGDQSGADAIVRSRL